MRGFIVEKRRLFAHKVQRWIDKVAKFDQAKIEEENGMMVYTFTDGSTLKYYPFMETMYINKIFSLATIHAVGTKFVYRVILGC